MVSLVEIKGFDEFDKYTKSIDDNGPPVLFYFSGAKLPDGNSWCPDCVEERLQIKELKLCELIKYNNKVRSAQESASLYIIIYHHNSTKRQAETVCAEPEMVMNTSPFSWLRRTRHLKTKMKGWRKHSAEKFHH